MSKTAKKTKKPAAAAKGKFKGDQVISLLSRASGATIVEVMKATAWQAHSVRGFMAGALKKKGHEVSSEVDWNGDRHYHIRAKVAS